MIIINVSMLGCFYDVKILHFLNDIPISQLIRLACCCVVICRVIGTFPRRVSLHLSDVWTWRIASGYYAFQLIVFSLKMKPVTEILSFFLAGICSTSRTGRFVKCKLNFCLGFFIDFTQELVHILCFVN